METIYHECYVSLEVAKLLKEVGFDWKCNGVFLSEDGTQYAFIKADAACDNNNSKYNPYNISAPTLDIAQRWLREVKNLVILIDISPSYCNWKPNGYKFVINISCGNHIFVEWKDTYEEAQEAGIKKALEIILDKGY